MTVLFDISRLLSRSHFETPTGIDRFELNYAHWAIDRFGADLKFIASGPLGHYHLPHASGRSLVTNMTQKWSSGAQLADQTDTLRALVEDIECGSLASRRRLAPALKVHANIPPASQQARKLLTGLFGTPLRAPSSSLFIHVSHSGIHRQSRYDWLAHRSCLPLFYVHDLIPLLRPEFCRSGESGRHHARVQTVLHLHRLVLCNSETTARTLDEMAEAKGLAQPFTAVLPPGLEQTFARFDPNIGIRTTKPYFVCLGTIEPRKNHALLLEVWRQLVERHGECAPRLVIVGRRGWDNSHVFSLLDNPDVYRGSVIEVAGLNDRAVAQLLSGASALLAPSHIEGYGMPVAEAMAIGTPVIASNIRAHREVSKGRAVLLDTLDGIGWLSAIEAHARWPRRNETCEQKHWTWAAHFSALHRLLVSAKLAPAPATTPQQAASGRLPSDRLTGGESCHVI